MRDIIKSFNLLRCEFHAPRIFPNLDCSDCSDCSIVRNIIKTFNFLRCELPNNTEPLNAEHNKII